MGGISPDKPPASCAECFAWGVLPGSCCRACYTFRNLHPAGRCAACRRMVPVKEGYCRLCRLQALDEAKAAGKTAVSERFLREVRHQQLFLARMHRDHYRVPGRARLGKLGTRGLRPKPAAVTRQEPVRTGVQLQFPLDLRRDFRSFGRRRHADLDNPAVVRARRAARALGEARGWSHELVKRVDEGLVVLLSSHTGEDKVRYSELSPAVRHRGRVAEVLDQLGLLDDDRVPAFQTWLQRKLDGITPGIRTEAEDWIRALHDGGSRTRPRSPTTVWHYFNEARPILLDWSHRYHHLREVTRDDIHTIADSLHGNKRRHTLCVLRSLFRHCKKKGAIFRDPTTRIPLGSNHYRIILPLETKDIAEATSAATTPAARLTIALAAIHSARTSDIGQLRLDDIDLGNRRLTIAGRTRPLDDLTHHALLDWLDYRRTHWPNTANPHLLINRVTAVRTCPVTRVWITKAFWGLEATLDRLHVDRQLEESLTHGPDPLHLAALFGLSAGTAIRYAAAARQLLDTPGEQHNPRS
jgi:integrase